MDTGGRDLLDTYYSLSPSQEDGSQRAAARCPNRPVTSKLDLDTGEMFYAGCFKLSCPVCVQTIARRTARAIGMSRPDQHVVLTQVGETWPEIRAGINAAVRILRRARPNLQYAYHVEPNPAGSGNHVHMWTWGGDLDEATVSDAATRAGLGREVRVGPRLLDEGAPLSYGLKEVLSHPDPGSQHPAVVRFRELNGTSLVRTSRNFYRDEQGNPIREGRRAQTRAGRARGAEARRLVNVWDPGSQI